MISAAQYFTLVGCFLLGLAPLMIMYLSVEASKKKWIATWVWSAFWMFPALSKLYVFALS